MEKSSGSQCCQGCSYLGGNGPHLRLVLRRGCLNLDLDEACFLTLGLGLAGAQRQPGLCWPKWKTAMPLLIVVPSCIWTGTYLFQRPLSLSVHRQNSAWVPLPSSYLHSGLKAGMESVLEITLHAHARGFRIKMSSLTMTGCYDEKCCFTYLLGLNFSSSF